MKNELNREKDIFVTTRIINIPNRDGFSNCSLFFLAKISEKDGYLAIYGTSIGFPGNRLFSDLEEAKVAIGREEEIMTILNVNAGQWLKKGESGVIEIEYDGKPISVSFSPKKGTYNDIPFEKIIDIS